jgi:hypothetical protein
MCVRVMHLFSGQLGILMHGANCAPILYLQKEISGGGTIQVEIWLVHQVHWQCTPASGG